MIVLKRPEKAELKKMLKNLEKLEIEIILLLNSYILGECEKLSDLVFFSNSHDICDIEIEFVVIFKCCLHITRGYLL